MAEAREAIEQGYADRMMLEFSPDFSFGVLSPAFKGNEGYFALQEFSGKGCTFFIDGHCALFPSSFRPLECRFCHHERLGLGTKCHHAIERDWDTQKGQRLSKRWLKLRDIKPPI